MFYLNLFVKNLFKSPVSGISFLLFSISLIIFSTNYSFMNKQILSFFPKAESGSYFYALISAKQNHAWVARKLELLPGVQSINLLPKEKLEAELMQIWKELQLSEGENIKVDYVGLKVNFKYGISIVAINSVKEYLSQLVNSEDLIIGKIKGDESKSSNHEQIFSSIKKWIALFGVTVLTIFWMGSFIFFSKSVRRSSYFVSQYQRRNKVGFKTMLAGFILLTVFFLIFSLTVVIPNIIGFLFIILLFALAIIWNYKKEVWEE